MKEFNNEEETDFKLRIGVGYDEAYIVLLGNKYLTFDCYGPSVVVAKHLEQTSKPNNIHIQNDLKHILSFLSYQEYTLKFEKDDNIHYYVNVENRSLLPPLSKEKYKKNQRKRSSTFHKLKNIKLLYYNRKEDFLKRESYKFSRWVLQFKNWETNKLFFRDISNLTKGFDLFTCIIIIIIIIYVFVDILIFYIFHYFYLYYIGFIIFYILFCFVKIFIIKHLFLRILFTIFDVTFITLYFMSLIFIVMDDLTYDTIISSIVLYTSIIFNLSFINFYLQNMLSIFCFVVFLGVAIYKQMDFEYIFTIILSYVTYLISLIFGGYYFQYYLLLYYQNKKLKIDKLNDLNKEMDINENLLKSSLPSKILKQILNQKYINPENKKKIYEKIENGSVMFCFVHDLLIFCEKEEEIINIHENIEHLNNIFTIFDDIIDEYHCSKIKSIGNEYLSICYKNKKNLFDASYKILKQGEKYFKKYQKDNTFSHISIGIHQGNFSAGIVGKSKYLYDVFGDTINTTHRIAENCDKKRYSMILSETFIKDILDIKYPTIKLSLKGKLEKINCVCISLPS